MGRPLRSIWKGPAVSGGVVEMTDDEIRDICAPVILTYVVNNPTTTYGTTVRINTAGTYDVSIGTGSDTRTSGALDAHPVGISTISTYTVYQNERAQTPVPLVRPVHYVVSGDVVQIKEMTNQEIIDNMMPAIAAEMLQSGQGSYFIGESAPAGGTWTSYGSFVDTYYDAGGLVTKTYNLWQRTSPDSQVSGPDIDGNPELRPLKQIVVGNETQLVEMSNTEIQGLYSYLGEYIRTTSIGKYAFQTSAPGTGTWESRGSFINRVNDITGIAYNGSFSGSFTKSYIGAWTGSYTPAYSQAYSGLDAQYIGYYTGVYASVYTKPYTVAYTTGSGEYPYVSAYYTLNPPANYVATVLYTRADSTQYAGNLSYLSTYTSTFSGDTGTYAGQYTGIQVISYGGAPIYYGAYVYMTQYTAGTMTQVYNSYFTRTVTYQFPYTSVYSRSYTGLGAPSGTYVGVSYTGPSGPTYIGGYTTGPQYSHAYTPTNPTAYTRTYTGTLGYTAAAYTRASGGSYVGFYTNADNTRAFAGSYTLSAPAGYAAVFSGNATYNSSAFTQDATIAFNAYYTGADNATYGTLIYAGNYTQLYTRVRSGGTAYTGPAIAFALGGYAAPSYTSAYSNQYTGPQQYVGSYTPNVAYNSSYSQTYVTNYTSSYAGALYVGSYVNYFTGSAQYTSSLTSGVAIFQAPYNADRSRSSYNSGPRYVDGVSTEYWVSETTSRLAAAQNIGNTTNWTVPASVTTADVYVIGGGGAGGRAFADGVSWFSGRFAANSQASGGGGAGGEVNYVQVTGLVPGSSVPIVVGAGGNPYLSNGHGTTVRAISGVNASSDYITSMSPHGFINGDRVLYYSTNAVSGGVGDHWNSPGTAIQNLTDYNYYYVVSANTTAFKLTTGSFTNTTPVDVAPISGSNDQIHVFFLDQSISSHGSNSEFGASSDTYYVRAQGGEAGFNAGISYFNTSGNTTQIVGTKLVASNTDNAAVGGKGGRSGWAIRYGTDGFGTDPVLFTRILYTTPSIPLGGAGGGYANAVASATYTQLASRDQKIINVYTKNSGGQPLVLNRYAHGEPSLPATYTLDMMGATYSTTVTGDVRYYINTNYQSYTSQTPFDQFYIVGGSGAGGGGSYVRYDTGVAFYVYGTIYPQYYYLGIYGQGYVDKWGSGGSTAMNWNDVYTQGSTLQFYGVNGAYEPTKIRSSDIDPTGLVARGKREWSIAFQFGAGNGGGGGYVMTGTKDVVAGHIDAWGGQGSPGAVYVFYSVDGPAYTSQKGYQRSFTGLYNISYTSSWAGYYTGAYTETYTNTGGYAGFYTGVSTYNHTTTSAYAASYSRSYTREAPVYVSRVYTGAYTTNYAGTPFVGNYAASFTTTYTGSFTGSFTGLTTQPSTTATTYTLWLRTA